ncbi:MAG: T9SS type B sorting domain-containing protein [Bacteroidota bacterium]
MWSQVLIAPILRLPFTSTLNYTDLAPGNYYVQVKSGANCYFDTTIVIQNIDDQKPQMVIQTSDQRCFINNGSIRLQVTGIDMPYIFQLNEQGFGDQSRFDNLAPGNHLLKIKNSFGCQWDTFAIIAPYPGHLLNKALQVTNPTCRGINDGSISLTVTGMQQPYHLYINGRRYDNGQLITGLTEGDYIIEVENSDQCKVDTIMRSLAIPFEQQCNDVYMPTAFTPNEDSRNDVLRPAFSSFIKNITMSIFNRYGRKIYEGKGNTISWDGTYRGVKQPPAVYVYMIHYTDHYGVQKMLKGTLSLIR